jgi:D-glutamate cyclase
MGVDTRQRGHIEHIAEALDQLATLEIRSRREQGVIRKLHEAARVKLGKPLALGAAELLFDSVSEGDNVILATGAGHRQFLPQGETDGPPGTVAIASVLAEGMKATPILVTELELVDNLAATAAAAAGLRVGDNNSAQTSQITCTVIAFPADDSAGAVSAELLDTFQPAALVSTEKIGPNDVGVSHYASGIETTSERARVECLFDLAAVRGVPTIGIGDNGNEIGFGLIADAVRRHKKWGDVCQCPCGAGLATRVATDALVVGSTSNWGAYAVAACLAAMLERPDLIRDPASEHHILEQCVAAGAFDGSNGLAVPSVDGTPPEVSASVQQLMKSVVEICSSEPYERPF